MRYYINQKLSISKAQFFYFSELFNNPTTYVDIVPTKTNIPNRNDGNAPNYSSLLKNLENIKSEFVTLREYVGDNADELEEKISEMINRTEISSAEFHKKADSIIQELQKIRNATNKTSITTSNEVIGLLKLTEYQSNMRMLAESKYGSVQDIEKMASQTSEIINLFDKMSIESEKKIPLPHEVRQWAISTIFDCADRWEIRFDDLFSMLLDSLGKNLLKESIRIQQVRDIFGIKAVDEIKNKLKLS
jgi:hypothetical protein